jgi:hypothetical protein
MMESNGTEAGEAEAAPMNIIKPVLAVICFGAAFFCGTGLIMAALSPLGIWGDPILWAPFTGMFLLSTYLLLRR